jgi:hypothetical protein
MRDTINASGIQRPVQFMPIFYISLKLEELRSLTKKVLPS